MNNETTQKSWMRTHPVWTGVGIFILFALAGSFANNNQTPRPVAVKEETKPAPVLTFEDKIKALATKAVGTTPMTYVGMDDEKADNGTSRMLTVKVNLTSIYSSRAFYRNTGETTGKLLQESFTSRPDVSDVIVWYNGDKTDKYGKTSNGLLISYAMDKKTFEKINWSNFDAGVLCDFLRSEYKASNGEATCTVLADVK